MDDRVSLADDLHDLIPAALDRGAGRVHRVRQPGGLEQLLHLGDLLGHRQLARADLWGGQSVSELGCGYVIGSDELECSLQKSDGGGVVSTHRDETEIGVAPLRSGDARVVHLGYGSVGKENGCTVVEREEKWSAAGKKTVHLLPRW